MMVMMMMMMMIRVNIFLKFDVLNPAMFRVQLLKVINTTACTN